jgi:hypothetical protein
MEPTEADCIWLYIFGVRYYAWHLLVIIEKAPKMKLGKQISEGNLNLKQYGLNSDSATSTLGIALVLAKYTFLGHRTHLHNWNVWK